KVAVALGAALLLAVLVVWLVWRESRRQAAVAARADHARAVLAAVDGLAAGLTEADSARCAFLVRAEPAQAERFPTAARDVDRNLRTLEELSAGDADREDRFLRVAALAGRKLAVLEESLKLRQRRRFDNRGQVALGRQAHALTEALRGPLAGLRQAEDGVLALQTH